MNRYLQVAQKSFQMSITTTTTKKDIQMKWKKKRSRSMLTQNKGKKKLIETFRNV